MDKTLTPTQARQVRRQKEAERAAAQAEKNRKDRNARKKDTARWERDKSAHYERAETERLRRKRMTKKARKREDIAKGIRPKMPWYQTIHVPVTEGLKRLFQRKAKK